MSGLLLVGLIATAYTVYLAGLQVPALLIALSTWLHTLATVVWVGYFLFTGLIYMPLLERRMGPDELRELLEAVSARLRPLFGGALLIFLATGTHLMLVNPSYKGFGDFFANAWSVLIIIKHVLVPAFLALAVLAERVFLAQVSSRKPQALERFRLALYANVALGAAILLLTSISIAQAG